MSAQLEADLASGAPPEVLIPGDLPGFTLAGDTLREHANLLEGTGDSLSRIEVTNWRGQASTGFRQVIQVEPGRWRTAADAFTAAAVALDGYSASVAAARELARQARVLYGRYESMLASAALLSGVPAQVPGTDPTNGVLGVQDRMRIGARFEQLNAIATGGALRGQAAGTPAAALATTTVYSADAVRREAIALLEQARRVVEQAGDLAADSLGQAVQHAPPARRLNETTIRPAAITDSGHTTLDAVGLLPVVGEIADGLNGLWYLNDGDTLNAGISAAGMLPLIGNAVVGGRVIKGGLKEVHTAADASLRRLADGGLVTHELPPGFHTIARHVGRSEADLLARVTGPGSVGTASTFATRAEAERPAADRRPTALPRRPFPDRRASVRHRAQDQGPSRGHRGGGRAGRPGDGTAYRVRAAGRDQGRYGATHPALSCPRPRRAGFRGRTCTYDLGMTTRTASQARASLSELLTRVQSGEEITITRHGEPAAVLVRPDLLRVRRVGEAFSDAEAVHELLSAAALTPLTRSGGLTSKHADDLIAAIRAGREAR